MRPSRSRTTRSPRNARLAQVVGDEHHRLAQPREDVAQVLLQLVADHRVERAERLVEQQHVRVEHQRAHQADALALAARRARAGDAPSASAGKRVERDAARAARVLMRASGQPQVARHQGDVVARRSGAGRGRRPATRSRCGGAPASRSSVAQRLPRRERRAPVSGRTSPIISRSRVDLPQPLGPTSTVVRPSGTWRSSGWSAWTSPKRLETCSSLNTPPPCPARARRSTPRYPANPSTLERP